MENMSEAVDWMCPGQGKTTVGYWEHVAAPCPCKQYWGRKSTNTTHVCV